MKNTAGSKTDAAPSVRRQISKVSSTRAALLACLTLCCCATASPVRAQDPIKETGVSTAFPWENLRNFAAQPAATDIGGLMSYLGPDAGEGAPAVGYSYPRQTPADNSGKLARFTRLAGMFMGRVSPLSIGNMRICFKIDIL